MEQINFQQTIERLKDTGFSPIPNVVQVTVPDAKRVSGPVSGTSLEKMPDGFLSTKKWQAGWPAMKVADFCVSATADAERPYLRKDSSFGS